MSDPDVDDEPAAADEDEPTQNPWPEIPVPNPPQSGPDGPVPGPVPA